jgi:catechol 2,3-dioxygenase-like lactoylglutathione lyase family enzyme
MIVRLDHITIGVRDLATAMQNFQRLGFIVTDGGTNKTLGTESAWICLGDAYLELIASFNPILTMQVVPNIEPALNVLDVRDAAMLGFGMESTDIQQDVEHLLDADLVTTPPISTERVQPDGEKTDSIMFFPEGKPWRSPWPFLYQRILDPARVFSLPQYTHSNGVTGIDSVAVGVKDIARVSEVYQKQFGFTYYDDGQFPDLNMRRIRFRAGSSHIDLLSSNGNARLQTELDEIGEGVFAIIFSVDDLEKSRAFLVQQGVECIMDAILPGTLLIHPRETFNIACLLKFAA